MDGPKYPKWVRDACAGLRCYHCQAPLGIVHIVEVGVERSSKKIPYPLSKPKVHIDFGCHGCRQRVRLIDLQSLQDVLDAAAAFVAGTDDLGPPWEAPVPFDNAPTAAADQPKGGADPRRFVIPPPLLPFDDREVRTFIHRMRTTSFDRRSLSFRQWMRRFGVDIDGDTGNP